MPDTNPPPGLTAADIREEHEQTRRYLATVMHGRTGGDYSGVSLPTLARALADHLATHDEHDEVIGTHHDEARATLTKALYGPQGSSAGHTLSSLAELAVATMQARTETADRLSTSISRAQATLIGALTAAGHITHSGTHNFYEVVTQATAAITEHRQAPAADIACEALLRNLYRTINEAPAINAYGDITRRSALAAIIDNAPEGVL